MSDINKPILIGIVGFAHHGKSTAANYLISNGFTEYAFAEPLKKAVMSIFGFTYEQCYDIKLKEVKDPYWGISPREAMIAFGEHNAEKLTELMPNLDLGESGRIWIRKFEHEYIKNKWNEKNIVVSDIRHNNEALAIKKLGGYILRVHNPRIEMNEEFRKSASEQRIQHIRFDGIIKNDSTIDEFHKSIAYLQTAIINNPKLNSNYEDYKDGNKAILVLEIKKPDE